MGKAEYDLILFGVTGFTGKLAAEYLWTKVSNGLALKWAVCARNEAKAKAALTHVESLVQAATTNKAPPPTLLVADLLCTTDQEKETLKGIVSQTRVVITTAGPFLKYGTVLVELCAQGGVHYADITGETSFVRDMIAKHDAQARETGATIVPHCGNDCIPQDLTVLEMHKYAQAKNAQLTCVRTYNQFPSSTRLSGGTIATAFHQMDEGKKQKKKPTSAEAANDSAPPFDPLLMLPTRDDSGLSKKSEFVTQVLREKSHHVAEFHTSAGPYIMSAVMANCVRRSNALLGYSPALQYSDLALTPTDAGVWSAVQYSAFTAFLGAAAVVPPLRGWLPQAGEGPTRDAMEAGYLITHGRGTAVAADGTTTLAVQSRFHFQKDFTYLMTAETLVECGLLLVRGKVLSPGVIPPAVAFGTELTKHLCDELKVSFSIKEEGEEGGESS